MFANLFKLVGKYYINILGWHTDRKLLIIESDDWGSAVLPSKKIFELLIKNGIRVDDDPYMSLDALASETDLISLYEVLNKFRDKNGNPPIITANSLMANPDYKKIRESNFESYHYELFPSTLERYPERQNSFKLWKEGIKNKLFYPQFHGREHLNTGLWLNELRKNKNKNLRYAFDNEMYILPKSAYPNESRLFNSAFYPNCEEEQKIIIESIGDGLKAFNKLFGFQSESFIATGYIWNSIIEPELSKYGVNIIQGLPVQRVPHLKQKNFSKRINYTGKYNKHNQVFVTRNAFFEPSLEPNKDWVNDCMLRIEKSFKWKKPAIVSSHRVNYVGYIIEKNRSKNLKLLECLLNTILKHFPDIEFFNTVQLGRLIWEQKFKNCSDEG